LDPETDELFNKFILINIFLPVISTRLILGPSWVNVDNIFNLKCILSFVFYLVSFTNNQKKEKILNFKVDQAKKKLRKGNNKSN
jgi:hypothetical protein